MNIIVKFIGACWSSGSAFDCRSRGSWVESYTGLTWISYGTRNESPRLHSTKICKFDIVYTKFCLVLMKIIVMIETSRYYQNYFNLFVGDVLLLFLFSPHWSFLLVQLCRKLLAYRNTRIYSWNQPVLTNECKVSC